MWKYEVETHVMMSTSVAQTEPYKVQYGGSEGFSGLVQAVNGADLSVDNRTLTTSGRFQDCGRARILQP